MTSGKFLGGPRPLVEHAIVVDFDEMEMGVVSYGPFGLPRPFTKPNPEVKPERVKECILSAPGIKFGLGSASQGEIDYNDFNELPADQRVEILQELEPRIEKWCKGILTSTSVPDLSEGEINRLYRRVLEEERARAVDELPQEERETIDI